MEKLDALARSGVATQMETLCTDVTFDIIGEVVTGTDCKAQDEAQSHDVVKSFKTLLATYAGGTSLRFNWLNISLQTRRYVYGKRLDHAVKEVVKEKFKAVQAGESDKKDRSVLALALKDTETLTPMLLQSIADQVKSFMSVISSV